MPFAFRCFQTIATVSDEAELPRFEHEHTCDPIVLARFEYWRLFCEKAGTINENLESAIAWGGASSEPLLLIDKIAVMDNRMAKRCELCIWLAFSVVFALLILPPWTEVVPVSDDTSQLHRRLWNAPLWRTSIQADYDVQVDYPRMLMEIGVCESFVLALYLTWGRR